MGFKRTVEDFVCRNCGVPNTGDGYTNHCAGCLHSLHVDVVPGDRAADCGGLMVPIGAEVRGDRVRLHHRCVDCGHTHTCRTSAKDDPDAIIAVASSPPPPVGF